MDIVVVRGGGDIASGIIYRLYKAGFKVVVLEIGKPLTIRRTVAFSEAVYEKEVNIEGVKGILAEDVDDIWRILDEGAVPVYIDSKGEILKELEPIALVDAILAKVNLGTHRGMAPITIGIGPGFEAGVDVDLVVESKRGHNLGKVIYEGKAAENTGIPGSTLGFREERVIRAPGEGIVNPLCEIGDKVEKGDVVCTVGEEKVLARISGILRGMLKEGLYAKEGLKIGDIDPRGEVENAFTISDKARAVGGGVLEGILYLIKERGIGYGR
ncbi:selenium-dependent molybdenum cofactor biosynthesis protein YqeB [Clostridium sp. Cult3]|uniref:selenium-dependent molybdenum cofactor biosynthesis protein YqeB n=1 Tax=Clostridium sp. Cult3 TaxID=2079004 RepID=UPI001F184D60|nr:selenium-dependent molybdenum cofactor biosynthesis protein YqeB [Clostridium sp. Cult3]MCF6459686.1 molybdenum hydroxylase [Clostridium sp. Cult3]